MTISSIQHAAPRFSSRQQPSFGHAAHQPQFGGVKSTLIDTANQVGQKVKARIQLPGRQAIKALPGRIGGFVRELLQEAFSKARGSWQSGPLKDKGKAVAQSAWAMLTLPVKAGAKVFNKIFNRIKGTAGAEVVEQTGRTARTVAGGGNHPVTRVIIV